MTERFEAEGFGAGRKRRYVITGAAGHLGSTIIRLLGSGQDPAQTEIYGLLLPGERETAGVDGVHYITGNICEQASMEPLFAGASGADTVVIHTAAKICIEKQVSTELVRVNVAGTRNIAELACRHQVSRFVHVSSVHAIPEQPKGTVIREVAHFSPELVEGGYAKTKAAAAQEILNLVQLGLPAVLIFPSGIIGPYDSGHNHLVQLVRDYLEGNLKLCVRGGYDLVDVRDVAQGCLLAADRGTVGSCYILNGHEVSIAELLSGVGKVAGRKSVSVMPLPIAYAAVPLLEAWAAVTGGRSLYTAYSLDTLQTNSSFSHEKATVELGYHVRDLQETIRDMTEYLQKILAAECTPDDRIQKKH